jgi:hypothetical protein
VFSFPTAVLIHPKVHIRKSGSDFGSEDGDAVFTGGFQPLTLE